MTVQQANQRLVPTDGQELWRRIDLAQERFVDLARSIGPNVVARATGWSTRQVVGHLLTVARRYTERDVRSWEGLGDTPRAVDEINERELRALDGVAMDELLKQLESQMHAVKAAFAPGLLDIDERFPFHGRTTIDGAGAMSNFIGEFLVHGYDLAQAAAQPWPIDSRDALLILNAVVQLLSAYAEPTATGTLDLVLRIPSAADWLFAFDNGKADSRAADSRCRPDIVLAAPAETLVLMLYQRIGPGTAFRRGLRVAGGRRPWRIVRFNQFLQQP